MGTEGLRHHAFLGDSELVKLAEEQAALRRLATAAARGAPPAEIFRAVAAELGQVLGADDAAVVRFEPDRTATVLAGAGRWLREVNRTASGPVAAYLRSAENPSVVASPIVVEGHLWGAIVAATRREPFAPGVEGRMADFTELAGFVVANAQSRAELMASRARVSAAGDEALRRVRRDLHDGAQQGLVNAVITLRLAQRALGDTSGRAAELVEAALAQAERASRDLRELAHGILPSALSRGGLRAGVEELVSHVGTPVSVEVTAERLPAALEATAYFIVAEALTNAVKHARASSARISAVVDGGVLWLEVRDDGIGGAATNGPGLLGLRDRVAALNGELRVESPPGQGTVVAALLPVPASQAA